MSLDPTAVDPAEAMLAQLAGLDMSLAQQLHACAMAAEDPKDIVEFAKAYHKIARSCRQSLAWRARLRRERLRDERDHPPAPPAPPPTPARDGERIAERREALRPAAQRVIWAEYEDREAELPYYFGLLEERLRLGSRDNAFGLLARDGAWMIDRFEDHLVRLCASLGLPEIAARAWRDLPDPPPEAFADLDPEDDEHEDDPAPPPAWQSSA